MNFTLSQAVGLAEALTAVTAILKSSGRSHEVQFVADEGFIDAMNLAAGNPHLTEAAHGQMEEAISHLCLASSEEQSSGLVDDDAARSGPVDRMQQ